MKSLNDKLFKKEGKPMRKFIFSLLLLPILANANISDKSIDLLRDKEFKCKRIDVGLKHIEMLTPYLDLEKNEKVIAYDGLVRVKSISGNELILETNFKVHGFSVQSTFNITSALEKKIFGNIQIYEKNDIPLDDFEELLTGDVSIATKVLFKKTKRDKVKEIWVRKGIINASNPFGEKAIRCFL